MKKKDIKKRKKNIWKKKVNDLGIKLKKALLVLCLMLFFMCSISAFVHKDSSSSWENNSFWQIVSEIPMIEDVIDTIHDFVEEIRDNLASVFQFFDKMGVSIPLEESAPTLDIAALPEYEGVPYVVVNENIPFFTKEECTTDSYEFYSELDLLGRCGVTMACIGQDIMPTEERGAIGMVKPTGWKLKKYDIVDGKYIYNRCHLIGYQLTGENANVNNLITGTRYMNVDGMLPFENEVADYIERTGNHVLYRVTPIFEGNNLVASGVQMEAYSVEDRGAGVCFHVYVYNVQPGIVIDYKTGDNWLEE